MTEPSRFNERTDSVAHDKVLSAAVARQKSAVCIETVLACARHQKFKLARACPQLSQSSAVRRARVCAAFARVRRPPVK